MHRLPTSLFAAVLMLLAGPAFAEAWGCYDSKPGHPTPAERAQFIDEVSSLAVAAEQKYGIPAAAIAAMSMVESGYGWTRTALEAHNLFGWKFYSADAAGGRAPYVLECQPPADDNNRYVVFANAADAFDFVAGKLATLNYYRKSALSYQSARAAGASAEEASKAWIAGIADPYNWQPTEYIKSITRVMNDPLAPSDTAAAERNLYRLSQPNAAVAAVAAGPVHAAADAASVAASSAPVDDLLKSTRAYFAARLTKLTCDEPTQEYPRWQGYPIQRCSYSDSGVSVRTYMLNPSADQLARWTVTACVDAQAAAPSTCARALSKAILEASSGVFPVAGFIPEPASSGGGAGSQVLCFLFRDGVTVTTAKVPGAPPAVKGTCASSDENEEAVMRAKRFARVVSTTRGDYLRNGGQEPVGTDVDGDPRWLDVVRALYQRAWGADRNELISARARAMRVEGAFK